MNLIYNAPVEWNPMKSNPFSLEGQYGNEKLIMWLMISLIGGLIALVGVIIIMYAPRS